MHVVYEYCDENLSNFSKLEFSTPPKSSNKIYNCLTRQYENWFSPDSKLGDDFAVNKSIFSAEARNGLNGNPCWRIRQQSLKAMKALYEIRTNEFFYLKSELEKSLIVDDDRVQKVRLSEILHAKEESNLVKSSSLSTLFFENKTENISVKRDKALSKVQNESKGCCIIL